MSSVDVIEIENFSKDSDHWWDENGPFKPLHALNPVRLSYIKSQICDAYGRDYQSLKPFERLSILDIGCGGGLVCEPLARLGASVSGADADANAIEVAKAHAKISGLKIDYMAKPAEDITPHPSSPLQGGGAGGGWDVVLALEIIEHVSDPAAFVKSVAALCKPEGLVIFSTLNRTPKSFALGIVAAEYILRWVPAGTHTWKKFIKPSELSRMARAAELSPHDIKGLIYNPIKGEFGLSDRDIDVNYLLSNVKT